MRSASQHLLDGGYIHRYRGGGRGDDCVKYLGVYMDDKLNRQRHIEIAQTNLSAAGGALFNLRTVNTPPPHTSARILKNSVFSLAICNHQLGKFVIHKLQVRQNRIVKIMCKRFGKKIINYSPCIKNLKFYEPMK